jgi:hypothetical protein
MSDLRQWAFIVDMNYSGSFTISDLWLWLKWLYFYPGDTVVYFILKDDKNYLFSQFFEIDYQSYGGVFSGIISFIVWVVFIIIGAATDRNH